MDNFPSGLGRSHPLRLLSRNPPVRNSDRVEILAVLFAVAAVLTMTPVVAAAGSEQQDRVPWPLQAKGVERKSIAVDAEGKNTTAPVPVRQAAPCQRDDLDRLVSTLETRFPDLSRAEVEYVVRMSHERLATAARITTHLIPLTLNASRRLLAQREGSTALVVVDALPTGSAVPE